MADQGSSSPRTPGPRAAPGAARSCGSRQALESRPRVSPAATGGRAEPARRLPRSRPPPGAAFSAALVRSCRVPCPPGARPRAAAGSDRETLSALRPAAGPAPACCAHIRGLCPRISLELTRINAAEVWCASEAPGGGGHGLPAPDGSPGTGRGARDGLPLPAWLPSTMATRRATGGRTLGAVGKSNTVRGGR